MLKKERIAGKQAYRAQQWDIYVVPLNVFLVLKSF